MRTLRARLAIAMLVLAPALARAADTPPDEVTRWNDRSTPRKTLETFWFAVLIYDLSPDLIVNAIDCLDLSGIDDQMRERDAALMAHELNFILSRLDVPLYGVPEHCEGGAVSLTDAEGYHISLARQDDGRWRFDRQTVARIGEMRRRNMLDQREIEKAREAMAEGRTDPETTLRTFTTDAMGLRDFAEAARCLDLRDVPPQLRATRGPELARKLAFVMQRCGFVFPQEAPSDPVGFRYVWHSNHRGRIMLERVRLAEGREAWLFSRNTLLNLDALVKGFLDAEPDPRYGRVGVLLDRSSLADGKTGRVPPPAGVPATLGSPRDTLRTFLGAMDELEYDDARARDALGCLDLSDLPPDDRDTVGLRLASKLEAILRHLRVDLLGIHDSWEAEPLSLERDSEWQVALGRGPDGAWRFDADTVSRVPEMFERLTPQEKTAREHRSSLSSPRQAMRTLLHAVSGGHLKRAAGTLCLDDIPPGARAELGPSLAYKLRYVLDRIGSVEVQEIPDEPEGPPYFYYRGSLGHIVLSLSDREKDARTWRFSTDTVAHIDEMFHAVLHAPPTSTHGHEGRAEAAVPPALWLRCRVPEWARRPVLGLVAFQWIGFAVFGLVAVLAGWLALQVGHRLARHSLRLARIELSCPFVNRKLRPVALQISLWILYMLIRLLDLPVDFVAATLPAFKLAWIALVAWSACHLIDLAMAVYTDSEHFVAGRSLGDMIVPTAARGLKLAILLVCVGWMVYLVGSGDMLTKMLAGLGLVGLAASLAAQDTLKNFFGTLLLIGEHPFRIGDHIVVDGMEGVVEAVGFRSTRLRTFDDSVLTIPNAIIAAASIDNRGARKVRRFRSLVGLAYGTPNDRLVAFRDALRATAEARPELVRADKTDIHLFELGDSSINLLVQVYFWVANLRDELEARDWLTREILSHANRLGVEIAFPTQTVYYAPQPAEDDDDASTPARPPVPGLHAAHAVPPAPAALRERTPATPGRMNRD